jgi:hypothetical protein
MIVSYTAECRTRFTSPGRCCPTPRRISSDESDRFLFRGSNLGTRIEKISL